MKEEMAKCEACETTEMEAKALVLMPLVDIVENDEGVVMYLEIPGANAQTVDVEIKDQVMSLSAASSLSRDGRSIVFRRKFQLSDGADVAHIKAQTKDGVLTLTIPKSERAKVHKIKVG